MRQLIFHVPNGGNRSASEGMQLKASGVVAGIPDLLFIHRGQLHYIEVKRPVERLKSGGGCSIMQVNIHNLWKNNGVQGIVAYSSDEIVDYVVKIISA
jgi:hypothetical protein